MSAGTGDFKELYYAARDGNLRQVEHFIQGADLDFLHPEFLTAPLHESIRNGHLAVSRFLLEQGANPNLREGYSTTTPLSIAQANGDEQAVDLLKAYGVVIEKPTFGRKLLNYLADWVTF